MADFTLALVSRLLGEPQHRLIHLCEQRAVVPDIEDSRGRGSSRRFSERNLLEFAVALALQKLAIPVSVAATVNYTLRQFSAGLQYLDLAGVALACVIASASKYALAWRGRHIFIADARDLLDAQGHRTLGVDEGDEAIADAAKQAVRNGAEKVCIAAGTVRR